MLFEKKFIPDCRLSSFKEADPAYLKSLGASAVICDIDNTLAPYETLDAPDEVVRWVMQLESADISLTLVSNNKEDRVARFNERLGCRAYSSVKKPSVKYLKKAMKEMGSGKDDTVFLGDQLLTDALAAHRAGIRAIIVPPIKDKPSLFFKFKRALERPFLRKYDKMHREDAK
ncbi:MAG: YqeG family HAD IIIA-type phosphatase [Clostridia bacterium]|nr:YqeG family HAD IIIA-type phosphatase [Clostridia bacterium]